MKALRICTDKDSGISKAENLLFSFFRIDESHPIDMQNYSPPLIGVEGCRFQRTIGEQVQESGVPEYRHMVCLVSGQIELSLGGGNTLLLQPGDLYLADGLTGKGHRTRRSGDCRTIQIIVSDSWIPPTGSLPPLSNYKHGGKGINLKRMYTGDDRKSYFRNFDTLFADTSGNLSPVKPLVWFYFANIADGYFMDWHPEGVNNFCFIMQGALELKVSGGNQAIEIFGPGDVCLAEDRVGEGHTDHFHGELCMAMLVFANKDLW